MGQYDELDKFIEDNNFVIQLHPTVSTMKINDFESLASFVDEEWGFWKNYTNGLLSNTYSKYNRIYIVKEQVVAHYNNKQIDNAIPSLNNLINILNQGHYLFYSKSPDAIFITNLYNKSNNCSDGAFSYYWNQLNYNHLSNKDYFEGVLRAAYFKDISNSANDKIGIEEESLIKLRSQYVDIITTHDKVFKDKSFELTSMIDAFKNEVTTLTENINDNSEKANNDKQNIFDELIATRTSKLDELEHTYDEKLKLEKPAQYWDDLYKDYRKKGFVWLIGTVVLSTILTVYLTLVLYYFPKNFNNSETFSHQNLKGTIILALIISVIVYLIRLFVKLSTSAYHLSRDAKERHQLTYFYLALINDNEKTIEGKDREIILSSLFSRADTGLLKGDSTPAFPGGMIETIFKNGKG